jgi:hypothetical protein
VSVRRSLYSLAAVAPPIGSAPATDIRDIRGPIVIASVWSALWTVVGIAALALALAIAIYWLVRRVRKGRTKTAAQLAIERLERARLMAREGRAVEFGFEISETVREYIQARFELRAPHLTTEEFLYELLSAGDSPVARHREALGEFLGACDLVKFARLTIDVEQQWAMVEAAESFVRATDEPLEARRDAPLVARGATS